MKTVDILSLPKNEASLSIVKSYLQNTLTKSEFELVFLRMLEIELFLNLNENVITEGEEFLNTYADIESKHYSHLLKMLFEASLNSRDLDRAIYYLEEYGKYVPVLDEYKVTIEQIRLAKIMNKPVLDLIIKLIQEPAPNEVKIPYHHELLNYYLEKQKYAEAQVILEELSNISNIKYYREELTILFGLGYFDEVIDKAERYKTIPEAIIPSVLALLKVYEIQQNHHRMTILDSEFESYFENASLEDRREFYQICANLYKELNIRQSEQHYLDNLKLLKKIETKQQKDAKTIESNIIKDVEITKVQPRKKIVELSKTEEKRQISNFYDIFMFAENINEKFILREYLRTLFIYIDNYIKPTDYAIYLNDGLFYHYKKERLYDKRLIPEAINHTIVKKIISDQTEFFSNPLDFAQNIDIITQLPYSHDVKYVYGIPLDDMGALLVYFNEEINDPEIYYDFVKLLSALIFSKIARESKVKVLRKENFFLTNIIQSNLVPLRTLSETKTTYNDLAQQMFNQSSFQHIDDFIKNLKPNDVRVYREVIRKMFSKPNQSEVIEYQYHNQFIKERMVSILDEEEIKIISTFQDVTETIIKIETSELKAVRDPETNLYNLSYLRQQMTELFQTKVTFIAVELNLDNRHLFGPDDISLYFKEFVNITDKFFIDGVVYRTNFNEIMVTIPQNDIRAVENVLKEYISYIEDYQVLSIPYEDFKIKMGVLRYPTTTSHTNVDKILKFIDIAKEKSKLRKDYYYHIFSNSDYDEEVFEQAVLSHLNEALENKNLILKFSQIIDVTKNLVWQYESQLSLANLNVVPKYLTTIAKKRNRIIDLERYHIITVLDFLVKLSVETKYLINITIPISEETFLDSTFNSFLIGAIKERKIPFSFIRLKIDLTNVKTHHYAHKIHDLLTTGIALDTTALAMALTYPFNALYIDFNDSDIKWQTYYRELTKLLSEFHIALIATKINSKDGLQAVKRLGIKYAAGEIYPDITEQELFNQIFGMRKNAE